MIKSHTIVAALVVTQFLASVCLCAWGAYLIYPPAAPLAAGVLLYLDHKIRS